MSPALFATARRHRSALSVLQLAALGIRSLTVPSVCLFVLLTVFWAAKLSAECDPVNSSINPNEDISGNNAASSVAGEQQECKKHPERNESGAQELVLVGVDFAPNSYQLRPRAKRILDDIARSLIEKADQSIEVAGYTDNRGSESDNLRLSEQRAHTVRTYLIRKGVSRTWLTATGYGSARPIADNNSVAGRKVNRRVVLHFSKGMDFCKRLPNGMGTNNAKDCAW